MSNSTLLIKIIKNGSNIETLKKYLAEYTKLGYSTDVLLEVAKDFTEGKRNLVLDSLTDASISNLDKIAKSNYVTDDDRAHVIKKLIDENIHISTLAYCVMVYINDPKKYFTEDEIKWILSDVAMEEIINKYGAYFAHELLDRTDSYLLLKVKKDLSDDVLKKIYKKSLERAEFMDVLFLLSRKEKKEYTRFLLDLEEFYLLSDFAWKVLNAKWYYDEDKIRLLKVIAEYAPANIIYEVLMNETLDEKEINMLEKSLLKTGNIEYISYYYFFKNKEKFILLFGSTLLFLSFVTINKEKFTDADLLNNVIESIKAEETKFTDDVNSKVQNSFLKKRNSK